FRPVVARDQVIVLVDLAVAPLPVSELARAQAHPTQQLHARQLGWLGPALDKVHNLIPNVVRDPSHVQLSPSSFFKPMCSSINSESTSCLRARRCSKCWICFSSLLSVRSAGPPSPARVPFSQNGCCQV